MSAIVRRERAPGYAVAAALLVAIGALMRSWRLGQQSFWHDEIASVWMAKGDESGTWAATVFNTHGPLYLCLLRGWMHVFGSGEAATRALSALLGVLGLVVFARVVRRFLAPTPSLVALALLVFSPFHLGYCQEVRGYSLLFACGLLAVDALLDDLEHQRPATFVRALLLVMAACLANLSGFFLLPIALVFAWALGRRQGYPLGRALALAALVAVLLSPWIVAGAESTGKFNLGTTPTRPDVILAKGESPPGLASIPYSVYDFTFGRTLGPNVDDLKLRRMAALKPHLPYLLPALVLVCLLLLRGWRAIDVQRRTVLGPWLVLPILATAALSIINFKAANSRYSFLAFAPFLVLLASGIAALGRPARTLVVLALLALFAWADVEYFVNPYYWKPDVRAAGALLAREARANDVVVVYALDEPVRWYVPDSIAFQMPAGEAFASDSGAANWLARHAPADRRLWIVQCNAWWMDRSDRFLRVTSAMRDREASWRFEKVPVWRFQAEAP